MSRSSSESEDGRRSNYQSESSLNDESNGGGVVLKKGPWTSSEDAILMEYVGKHGEGNWNAVQKHSGLSRCGKSCRLRWANHLRPNLKKGAFTPQEEATILELHAQMGNKWARMASYLIGRTDNEIKNYWNTRVKRRQRAGLPLYPPDLCMQTFNENQQGQSSGAMGGQEFANHESVDTNPYDIPELVFDGLKGNIGLYSFVSESAEAGTALMKSMASSAEYYSVAPPRQKRLRECCEVFSGDQNVFPPDVNQFKSPEMGIGQGVQSLQNGKSSASTAANGAVKSELPSLQYQEPDWGDLSLFESPDAFGSSNSGLIGDLIHESQHRGNARKASPEKSWNSSPGDVMSILETEWNGYAVTSLLKGYTGSSLDGSCVKVEAAETGETRNGQFRPDVMLNSDWFDCPGTIGDDDVVPSDSWKTMPSAVTHMSDPH